MADAAPRGVAWVGAVNLAGGATGAVVGLLLAAVVGRHLGADGAGAYFLVVAAFMIVSNVTELGADTGLVRFVSAARATGRRLVAPHLLAISVPPVVVTGVAVVVVAALWAASSPDQLAGVPPAVVVLAAVGAVLSSLIALMLAVTRGHGDVLSYPLLQNLALPLLRLAGVLAVVATGGGVTAILVAWIAPVPVVLAVSAGVAVVTMARAGAGAPQQVTRAERRDDAREFWSFSAARGLSAAAEILLEWVDVILVGLLASPEEAGIYAVVTRCARAGEVVQQAARIAVGPQISAALARGETDEAGRLYGLVTAAMIWLAWPFFIVLTVFADVVLSAFGPGFADGAVSLAVLSGAMALATAAGTVQTILLMGGRSRWQLADKSVSLLVNVCLNLVLVPWWGIEGAAVAWAVTIVVDTGIVVDQVQRRMGVRPRGSAVPTAAALAVGVVVPVTVASRLIWGGTPSVMIGSVVVAAAAYLAATAGLRHRLGLVELACHR